MHRPEAWSAIVARLLAWSLIAAAPLTRRGVDAESAADHVVHTAWVALAFVGAATGLVALVGGRVVTAKQNVGSRRAKRASC